MTNLNKKEINHIKEFQESITIKEIEGFGNIFINCSNIIPIKKLYNFYIEYLEKKLLESLEISKKNNNSK